MKTKELLFGACLCMFTACNMPEKGMDVDVYEALDYCDAQVQRTLTELKAAEGTIDYSMMPRNIMDSLNTWHCRKATKDEWCSGFWPGVLWYDYEYTGKATIKEEAEKFTEPLKFLSQIPAYDHDLGFLIFCSYGNGYRLTHNPEYKQVILDTADSLATLFRPRVGTILSWPRNIEMFGGHNTIMDNMINLEMLFWAAKNGGNPYLADIAVSHADKTMKYQFRPDYTSYHVAVYDTLTGRLHKRSYTSGICRQYHVGARTGVGYLWIYSSLQGNIRSTIFGFCTESNRCIFRKIAGRLCALLGF